MSAGLRRTARSLSHSLLSDYDTTLVKARYDPPTDECRPGYKDDPQAWRRITLHFCTSICFCSPRPCNALLTIGASRRLDTQRVLSDYPATWFETDRGHRKSDGHFGFQPTRPQCYLWHALQTPGVHPQRQLCTVRRNARHAARSKHAPSVCYHHAHYRTSEYLHTYDWDSRSYFVNAYDQRSGGLSSTRARTSTLSALARFTSTFATAVRWPNPFRPPRPPPPPPRCADLHRCMLRRRKVG
jgi:hypothetical protein